MLCVNLTDFKPAIEDRFAFWDGIRGFLDQVRLELKTKVDQQPDWLDQHPDDRLVLIDLTMHLHQCLLKTVERYSNSLQQLEEMEISDLKMQKRNGKIEYAEISEYTNGAED